MSDRSSRVRKKSSSLRLRNPHWPVRPLGPLPSERFGDICTTIVICVAHSKVALLNTRNTNGSHYRWFPYLYFSAGISVKQVLLQVVLQVLRLEPSQITSAFQKHVQNSPCINICRVQLPQSKRFVTRLIYFVRIESNVPDPCIRGTQSSVSLSEDVRLEWHPIVDLMKERVSLMWGPEVKHFCKVVHRNQPVRNILFEFKVPAVLAAVRETKSCTAEENMLADRKVTEKDIERLYDDFYEHCFPCCFMNENSFQAYCVRHGIETDVKRISRYFVAFRFLEKPVMSFQELVIGLVAIDRDTSVCETRFKIMFRYYDVNGDGVLDRKEFAKLVEDLTIFNGEEDSAAHKPDALEAKTAALRTALNRLQDVKKTKKSKSKQSISRKPSKSKRQGSDTKSTRKTDNNQFRLSFSTFLKAIERKILVGTSKLCRSKVWIIGTISRALISRKICQTFAKLHRFHAVVGGRAARDKCVRCWERNTRAPYSLAAHIVYLSDARRFCSAVRIANQRLTISKHSTEIQFHRESLPNIYINLVRLLERSKSKGTVEDYRGLLAVVPANFKDQLITEIEVISRRVEEIIESEPRVVQVSSPVVVIGDIHGNLEDLLSLETTLWPALPLFHTGQNYLFLGDYVDRGRWGFECALYLFCLKLLCPNRVTLLRGNHEVRTVQKTYSFENELMTKYGKKMGPLFFESTNRVFDRLPSCAVVDGKIFCVHGGIPYTGLGQPLRDLQTQMPKVCPTPEVEEPNLVWEMLWSDPIEDRRLQDEFDFLTDYMTAGLQTISAKSTAEKTELTEGELVIHQLYNYGYLPNRKRGTGYLFSEYALGAFLGINELSHMIRAHEVPLEGYRLNFQSRCITVFSCSHYCGVNNECAVVLLDHNRIRVLQIDTSANSPATDG